MKFGVPWSVKGIRPEARETAKEAARRSGLSLGDWLNTVILQQAAQAGLPGQQPYANAATDTDSHSEELAGVHQRLDDLTRRLEQFTRTGPAAYAPRRERDQKQTADLIGRLDQRLDQLVSQPPAPPLAPAMAPTTPPPRPNIQVPPALDRALAEIAARQRTLNDAPAQSEPAAAPSLQPAPPPEPPAFAPLRAAVPMQDLSGLEQQLRTITDQIETLRKPGVEEAINALRGELADIGRALNDAMPKQAIDALEKQIAGLSQRVAEGRQAGVDAGALAGIERGLAEVRDALHGLMPAEHLVGFTDAVTSLAQKIDLIVAQKDPATLQQLEDAINTLRGMASSVASDEVVGRLAAEVQRLADNVEQIARTPVGDVLNSLENRIDALSRALAERAEAGNTVPPRLEALVQSLTDKIEQIQQSRHDDNVAVSHLEDRIVRLVERLDASDSRLGHLEAIERGLADLLVHIEEMRASKQDAPAGDSPAVTALKQDMARSQDALKQDMTRTQDALLQDMARTQDTLDALHGTLGLVVDRLAVIEKGIRSERRAPPAAAPVAAAAPAPAAAAAPASPDESEPLELTEPVGRLAVRLVSNAAETTPAKPAAAAPMPAAPKPFMPAPAAPQAGPQPAPAPPPAAPPINPELPPDQPLEPGSGPPQFRATPSARIAASEAALGGARPAQLAGGGQSNFIAAARRAAKAAQQEQDASAPRAAEPAEPEASGGLSLQAKMMKRVKSLLVAASVIAIMVGAVQIVGHRLGRHSSTTNKIAQRLDSKPAKAPATPKLAAAPAANPLMAPATVAPPPRHRQASAGSATDLLNPPALYSGSDITGSIPEAADDQHLAPPAATPQAAGQLPSGIGSRQLRQAALGGDAGAAYEVAVRFAEGRGVPANLRAAAHWYKLAAAKGLALAQFRYASMLEKGVGVKKDLARARRLYRAAAEQGNAKAMHNLAVLYAEGVEGKPDYVDAVTWFRKAAQHGIADSQYNLGILYARGIGVSKDLVKSYKWFALAASHGDKESANKRDGIAARLDPQQLAAARQAVAHFKVEPQPKTATAVPTPPGGWDKANAAPAKAQAQPDGPLSLGAFTIGQR